MSCMYVDGCLVCTSMDVLYVRLVGIGAQARLHQELSMGMGWKGYGGVRGGSPHG